MLKASGQNVVRRRVAIRVVVRPELDRSKLLFEPTARREDDLAENGPADEDDGDAAGGDDDCNERRLTDAGAGVEKIERLSGNSKNTSSGVAYEPESESFFAALALALADELVAVEDPDDICEVLVMVKTDGAEDDARDEEDGSSVFCVTAEDRCAGGVVVTAARVVCAGVVVVTGAGGEVVVVVTAAAGVVDATGSGVSAAEV